MALFSFFFGSISPSLDSLHSQGHTLLFDQNHIENFTLNLIFVPQCTFPYESSLKYTLIELFLSSSLSYPYCPDQCLPQSSYLGTTE